MMKNWSLAIPTPSLDSMLLKMDVLEVLLDVVRASMPILKLADSPIYRSLRSPSSKLDYWSMLYTSMQGVRWFACDQAFL